MKFAKSWKTNKSRTTLSVDTEDWKERIKKIPKNQIYLEYVDGTESTVELGTLRGLVYVLCPWLLNRDLKRNRKPKKEASAKA